jgi:hypothetical protein
MINFPGTPDKEFIEILDAAFEHAYSWNADNTELANYLLNYDQDKINQFRGNGRATGPVRIRQQIDKLIKIHKIPYNKYFKFQLTDWSWFLLYHILDSYIQWHNDTYYENEITMVDEVETWHSKEIDFDDIIDEYFWDTDFLLGEELGRKFIDNPNVKAAMGIDESTIRLITGQKASIEDLNIPFVSVED